MAATQTLPRPKAYDDTFYKPISIWLTTTDHKLIGIMYMTTGMLSFVVGGIFALVMRIQLSQPNEKVIDAATYNQLVSAHGTEQAGGDVGEKLRLVSEAQRGAARPYPRAVDAPPCPRA